MTQSAASMMGASDKAYSTSCPPLDDLLGGGLKRGSVLEISGPPGCGKERVAVEAIKSFVASGKGVLFVGMYSDFGNPYREITARLFEVWLSASLWRYRPIITETSSDIP